MRVQDVAAGLGASGAAGAEIGWEAGGVDVSDSINGLVVADALTFEIGFGAFQDGAGDGKSTLGLELIEPILDTLAGVLASFVYGA